MAVSLLAALHRSWRSRSLVCLYAHHVFDDQRQYFARIIDSLLRHGRFVDTGTCLRLLEGSEPLEGVSFHLSFDDGLANIHGNAFPVLRDRGILPAFFVPTAMVGADFATERAFSLEVLEYAGAVRMASRDQLRELADSGWALGSHTRTHRRLTDKLADPGLLRSEIWGSKAELEDIVGKECRYFAWPFGRTSDLDERALDYIRQAGYDACFGAFRGSVNPGVTDRWRIPRHHFEADWPLSHVEVFARGNPEPPVSRWCSCLLENSMK